MHEELRKKYGTFSDSTALIREDRDRADDRPGRQRRRQDLSRRGGADAATELLAGPVKLLAPELIRLEVAGALCRRVRQGELQAGEAEERCQHWLAELDKGLFTLTADRGCFPRR